MKVIFFGTPDFVLPVIKVLDEDFNLVSIISSPNTNQVKSYADEKNIPLLTPQKLDEQFVEHLKKVEPDLIVVAAYGKIIPQAVLDIPKYGNLNIHPSILPKYRGASPIQSAILNGDNSTGVTIMVMDEKMDHGPVLIASTIGLSDQDNNLTLSNKLFEEGSKLLSSVLPDFISKKVKPTPQDHTQATFCKLIKKEDGFFEIDNPPPSEKLDRMVRAYYPWPTAWTKWKGKIIKFLPTPPRHPESSEGSPTNVGNKFLVQMEGKNPTKLEDFLRGYPDFPIASKNH